MHRRKPAVAGAWYPDSREQLASTVDAYLSCAPADAVPRDADLVSLIAPHAGLMYSGPVAAHAYALLRGRPFDVAVLVGPSHHVAFDGVAVWPDGVFETPLGDVTIDADVARRIMAECPLVHERIAAHVREHSLEMQLPFLVRVAPGLPIVPLVMGSQDREMVMALGGAIAAAAGEAGEKRRVLVVASSDLSHYADAVTAATLDAKVTERVERFDVEGLMALVERRPDHACGGGPMVAAMQAARALGATRARVLCRADSGDMSGDTRAVVGYMAAALTHERA